MMSTHSVMLKLWQYGPEGATGLGQGAVRALVKLSLDSSPKLRSDAVQAMMDIGKDAVPELLHLVQYGAGDIKVRSATILGMIGEKAMIPEALETLRILESNDNIQACRIARLAIRNIEKRIQDGDVRKSEPCRMKEGMADGADMAGEMLEPGIREPKRLTRIESGRRKSAVSESADRKPRIVAGRKKAVNM